VTTEAPLPGGNSGYICITFHEDFEIDIWGYVALGIMASLERHFGKRMIWPI
jgi:hypothetical protein